MGRLAQRLRHYQLGGYGEYFHLLTSGKFPTEAQIAVDLLTTNETHFFREQRKTFILRNLPSETRSFIYITIFNYILLETFLNNF